MVVTRLTLQRRVLAVQAHTTSAAFVMTAIAIRYQYKVQRQLQRAGWRGLAQGLLYGRHHRDDMLSNSSRTHSIDEVGNRLREGDVVGLCFLFAELFLHIIHHIMNGSMIVVF
jgi:hypothetical protein